MPVVGVLHSQTQASGSGRILAIERGLQAAGFVVGRNVVLNTALPTAPTIACRN